VSLAAGRAWITLLNLLAPGAGLIVLGRLASGLLFGALFGLCANAAVWATLLVPDEFPRWSKLAILTLAALSYLAAQVRLAQSMRREAQRRQTDIRRAALVAARECLMQRDPVAALAALRAVQHLAARDVVVAYRYAQVYTALQDADAAHAAWQQVRRLDRDGVYRDERRAGEKALRRGRVSQS